MKLILVNFRCYRGEHVFEFCDNGVTLLIGHSGVGKTTILSAFLFLIQGTGNGPRNITDGENKCSVELQIDDLIIKRTHRPNRLILRNLGSEIEDDEAQSKINKFFGPRFEMTSYIQQQYHKNFLALSSAEKFDFFETLLFNFDDLEKTPLQLKKGCSIEIKMLTSSRDRLAGGIQSLANQIEKYKPPKEYVQFSDVTHEGEQLERRLLFLKNRQKIYEALLQKLRHQEEERDKTVLHIQPIQDPELNASEILKLKTFIQALTELESLQYKKYQDYTIKDCEETIREYEEDIRLANEAARVRTEIRNLCYNPDSHKNFEKEWNKLYNAVEAFYKCPSCLTSLCLKDGHLEKSDENTVTIIQTDMKRIKLAELKKTLFEFDSLAARRLSLSRQLAELNVTENEDDLESQLAKWKDYSSKIRKIEKLKPLLIEGLTLNDAILKLKGAEEALQKKSRIKAAEERKIELEYSIYKLKESLGSLPDSRIDIENLSKKLVSIELHQKILKEIEEHKQRESDLKEMQTQLASIERRRIAFHDLKELISCSRVKYLELFISDIEEMVNNFCEKLFDEPLVIKISLDTEKTVMSLEIYYKGMKTDVSYLSGGEYARLNLALTLTFSKKFGGRILLLDEITSQINQELSEKMLSLIQDSSTKTLLVAHGLTEGGFDEVVNIGF